MLNEKLMYWFSKPVVTAYTGTMLDMSVEKNAPLPKGAKIIAANHPTTTDPFFVAAMLRQQSFIMINDLLFQVPLLGAYLRRSGHIQVAAGSGQQAVDRALSLLRQGKTVIIFPEGALSPSEGGFQDARTGVARLALASGAPVIPVGIYLERERIRRIKSTVRGKVEYGVWYLKGPYYITTGEPLTFTGDVEDHAQVRKVAKIVMHHIIEMAWQSEQRMTQTPPSLFPQTSEY
ncbi:MAG TPA: lysophospholipid acyltransferase family protein [Longilinea sp.]|nr:lysophospholipid acyltransferase family protein [Longilinea sp.]